MWLALNTIGVRPSIFTMTSPTMALSTVSFHLVQSSRFRAGGKEPSTSRHRLWFSYPFTRFYLASGHKVCASSCFPSFRSVYDSIHLLVVINKCLIRSHLSQATQLKSHVRPQKLVVFAAGLLLPSTSFSINISGAFSRKPRLDKKDSKNVLASSLAVFSPSDVFGHS